MRHLHNFVGKLFTIAKGYISVSADFYIGIAAGLLLLPIPWLGAWLLSTFVHELFHFLALQIFNCRIMHLHISLKGFYMETENITLGKEAICAYAGPLGALLLLLFARQLPRTAVCVIVQSIYNLLPVFPLDGGRGLGCILRQLFGEEKGTHIFQILEAVVLSLLVALTLYSVLKLGLGLLPAAAMLLLIIKNKKINIPCKKLPLGLQ